MFAEMLDHYILQNWILILILFAFVVFLVSTALIDKKATRRLFFLIGEIFVLSLCVFCEFHFAHEEFKDIAVLRTVRTVLMAIRYSAAPMLLAHVIFTVVKRMKALVFIPAGALAVIDIVSIPTGIVFSLSEENKLIRGPLGYLPFIIAGLYCAFLIYILIKRSNKRSVEIIPIILLAVSFVSCITFPFIFRADFAQLFCPTIAVALFIYYVFSILSLVKKDALTGLLNRQAYYSETSRNYKDITAIISIDMNGLKKVNDTYGHQAGDEALIALAICFSRACKVNQSAYRMGGDEFAIVCRKNTEEEVLKLIERINELVSKTKYTCSIGYSFQKDGHTELEELLKVSDERMYTAKAEYYKEHPTGDIK